MRDYTKSIFILLHRVNFARRLSPRKAVFRNCASHLINEHARLQTRGLAAQRELNDDIIRSLGFARRVYRATDEAKDRGWQTETFVACDLHRLNHRASLYLFLSADLYCISMRSAMRDARKRGGSARRKTRYLNGALFAKILGTYHVLEVCNLPILLKA